MGIPQGTIVSETSLSVLLSLIGFAMAYAFLWLFGHLGDGTTSLHQILVSPSEVPVWLIPIHYLVLTLISAVLIFLVRNSTARKRMRGKLWDLHRHSGAWREFMDESGWVCVALQDGTRFIGWPQRTDWDDRPGSILLIQPSVKEVGATEYKELLNVNRMFIPGSQVNWIEGRLDQIFTPHALATDSGEHFPATPETE